jgi:hypothetical protein
MNSEPELSTMEKVLLEPLLKFFADPSHFEILQRYRDKQSNVSVSLLDWFVVNYAKKFGVRYEIMRNGQRKTVHVEQSYAAALYAHTKEYFDPFARGSKQGKGIIIQNKDGDEIITTVRQLNFFRWAINNGVIEYIDRHVSEIHKDMTERSNRGKKKTPEHKKKQLSVSASRTLGIYNKLKNEI